VCTFKTFQSRIKKKYAVDLHEYQLDSPTAWNVALLSTASGIFWLNLTCTQSAFNNTAWSFKRFGVTCSQQKERKKPKNLLEFLECVWNQITYNRFTFDTNTNGKCKIQFLRS